jgi:hypothetical protein
VVVVVGVTLNIGVRLEAFALAAITSTYEAFEHSVFHDATTVILTGTVAVARVFDWLIHVFVTSVFAVLLALYYQCSTDPNAPC